MDKSNVKTAVIFEDDPVQLEQIARVIRDAGYDVLAFGTGQDAAEIVKANDPEVCFVDLVMSEGPDGFVTMRNIRMAKPDVSIVVCTFHVMYEDFCTDLGADAVMRKPIDQNLLLKTLASIGLAD